MWLRVVSGPERGRELELVPGRAVKIGRGRECRIRLGAEDAAISKVHCEVVLSGGRAWVRDLRSSGGTRVNGKRLDPDSPVEIHPSDELRLSATTALRVEVDAAVSPKGPTVDLGRGPLPAVAASASPPPADEKPSIPGFELVRELGKGGFGRVFLAVHAKSRGTVAIKVLSEDVLAKDPAAESAFLRELTIEAKLDHPNIVKMITNGSAAGRLFYVMEYVNGFDLDHYVRSVVRRPLTPEEAVAFILPVLDAVEHAHERGIVHRDLKPQNILVASPPPEPRVKLADFGLAKSFETTGVSFISATGVGKGTLGFMPPEQVADAKHVGPAADIYALGATLFFLLTLATPVDAAVPNWLATILEAEPRSLRDLDARISPELDRVVGRAVARSPDERFPTIAAFRTALLGAMGRRGASC